MILFVSILRIMSFYILVSAFNSQGTEITMAVQFISKMKGCRHRAIIIT